ncbi:hypothetical protein ACFOQM_09560 [Paenibacillus sp. GCM10012307]|uniref:Uncharacterized protein n=1 Tax=Paenibacillus roseus TaxID=2798579 RepID=A0A934IYE5_9BACL|nr:hypothetical protein [Paenibacillus roseus]MBJ6361532.1 hypothetical protein [Paenibacillus roseus]
MRSILISVLLIAAIIVIYTDSFRGDGGAEQLINGSGSRMSRMIEGIDP